MRTLPFAAAIVALLVPSAPAHAETAPFDAGCRSVQPLITASLPANVPGLAFYGSYAPSLDTTDVSLIGPDGTRVPTTVVSDSPYSSAAILRLSEPLVAGKTYTLKWSDECATGRTKTFYTDPITPLPTSAGTITVSEPRPPADDATCIGGKPNWPAQRFVYFAEDPALIPFLPVSKIDLIIDDKVDVYSAKAYGQYTDTDPNAGLLHQSCPAGPRTLRVALRVRIANGPTLTTPEITTELRCLDTLPGGCPEAPADTGVDTGVFEPDPEPADTSVSDPTEGEDSGVAPSVDAGAAPRATDDVVVGGCTCNTPAAATPFGGVALALIALPLARRRARRRPTRSSGDG